MRELAVDVVHKLKLDYTITCISSGETRWEIVMWDRPRDRYFTVRGKKGVGPLGEDAAEEIERQLTQRLGTLTSGGFGAFGQHA